MNLQKLVLFLHTSNEKSQMEIKDTSLFANNSRKNKKLRNKLNLVSQSLIN
jgi:hypothetical protein